MVQMGLSLGNSFGWQVSTPAHLWGDCLCGLHFLDKIHKENGGKLYPDIFYLSLLLRKRKILHSKSHGWISRSPWPLKYV